MAHRKYDHDHIYVRLSNGTSFKCIVDNCPHVMHGGVEYILGKKAQCPYCHNTFIITLDHARRKYIHCLNCTKNGHPIEKPIIEDKTEDVFSSILKGMASE